ncbi:MAG: molecular chaperone DnaK [Verrucomicrobia bacterium]|nr:molecular chaperone DnaK [Verrucomicrobiota bacterium]
MILGIDLGTTNSLVAMVDSGVPLVLADVQGRRLTPSVVHFPVDGGRAVVGHEARRMAVVAPGSTLSSVKRLMGRRFGELSEAERAGACEIRDGGRETVEFGLTGGRVTNPVEVSAEILRRLVENAEAVLGVTARRVVITVPAYFNEAQRQATKRAGERAGLTVERILNEPTAAALAYGLNRLRDQSKIAVFDLGGGTFDLSILELHEGVFQVRATHGDTRLGGDDLDRRVMEKLAGEIRERGGMGFASDPVAVARLREAVEDAKIRLSSESAVEIRLPFLTSGFSYQRVLERKELEVWTRDILLRTRISCLRALEDARLRPEELDQVILVGGQTRMPLVRELVSEWFGCVEFEALRGGVRMSESGHSASGPLLNTSQNPDEAVALGAAIQGAILQGGVQGVVLLDVTPLSLGLETFGGLMNVLIPRNSTVPVKAGEVFTTAVDFQSSMLIHVLQGEREKAADNWSLGRFAIEFERAPRGVPRVGVQFEIDANGMLQVLARDLKTLKETRVQVASAVDVEDSAVQKMVEESVEHAWEDLRLRRWVEAKLKAEQVAEATRSAMVEFGGYLEEGALARVQAALARVEALLRAEESGGEAEPLRQATVELDEATRPLADLMMDQAMEALLKRRGVLG